MNGDGVYKSVEYTVYCNSCKCLIDFDQYRNLREAEKRWKREGWRKYQGAWKCPDCYEYAKLLEREGMETPTPPPQR